MPTINRIRIVNIVYDGRVISDRLFDYYGGRSALMNLANGCGKTVMVESIFQPIIPGMDIGGWKITDYLTGDSKPSYVMIEWLLDETKTPSYFMTGICLSKTVAQGDDDKKIKALKYFNFVHDYSHGNEYDIANIPISETKNGKKVFYTYNEFQENLKKYKRSHDSFDVFVKDKKKDYQDYLVRHRIYDHEWALLARINQAESGNGLAGLFQNCKTSDELFDKWILKTVYDINKPLRQSLIKETASLIKPMIASSKALSDKEIMEGAAGDLNSFSNIFKDYTAELDRKEGKEKHIAGVLKHTIGCIKAEESKRAEAVLIKKECIETERRIRHEELSEQYQEIRRSLDASADKLAEFEADLPKLEKEHSDARYEWHCMCAAEYYGRIKTARDKIEAAGKTIAALENNETANKKKQVGAAIFAYYCDLSESLKALQTKLRKELEDKKSEREALSGKRGELEKELSALNNDIGRFQERCDSFSKEEIKYEEAIGILPDRDLTGNLTSESIERISKQLASDIAAAEELLEKLDNKRCETEEKLSENTSALQHNRSEIATQTQAVYAAQHSYEIMKKAAEEVSIVLQRYDISDSHLFEREENLAAIREIYSENEGIYQTHIRERDRLKETHDKLTRGELHTSSEFAKLLTKNGIEFQTGETYLKMQHGEYYDLLLKKNPLLPYCFIVSDKDYDRVPEISNDFSVDRVCPVIRRKDFEADLKTSGYYSELGIFKLYSIYNKSSLDPDTRNDYASSLENDISKLDDEIYDDKTRLEKISSDIRTVESFKYSDGDSREIKAALKKAEDDLKQLESYGKTLEENEKALSDELAKVNNRISENNTALDKSKGRENKYREYLNEAEKDLNNRKALAKAISEADAINNSIKDIHTKAEQLSKNISQTTIDLQNNQHKSDLSDSKAAEFAIYFGNEPEAGEIGTLEIEFKNLSEVYDGSIREQQSICSEARSVISENEKRLRESYEELTTDDYGIPFDAYKLSELEKAERNTDKALYECQVNLKAEQKENEKLNSDLKKKNNELSRYGFDFILEDSQIIGKYSDRREANKERLAEAEKAEENANAAYKEYSLLETRLEKVIDFELFLDDDSVKPVSETIDVDKLRDELNTLKNAVIEKRRCLKKEYDRIQEHYKGQHEWIAKILSFIDIDSCNSYIECFKIYEQLLVQQKLLDDNIKVLSAQLEQIENDRKHIIIQMIKHAEFLYDQIRSITDHSYIRIDGKNKRIMQINIPDKLDSGYQDRIGSIIDDTLIKLRNSLETEEISDDELLRRVNSFFTDRLLFNAATGSNSVSIRVWKSLKDERNSRLEKWESRYSGGEHFLVYFVVYTALVSYARRRHTTDDNDNIRSVFLIDNPFGETSSEHLLHVFIEIANKFKLQAICFSDLKQDSITKNFDLIYQMSLREAAYSNRSYLTINEILNNANAESDTQLDFVSMNSQLSFI